MAADPAPIIKYRADYGGVPAPLIIQHLKTPLVEVTQALELPNPAGEIPGAALQQLESTLDQIGVHEDDIDDLLIGWRPGDKEMDLYGYASRTF